jgi:DsbC/DsbD-like thiol-disulfide interchange protein
LRTISRRLGAGARDAIAAAIRAALYLAIAIALGAIASAAARAALTAGGTPVVVQAGNVEARITLAADRSSGGQQLGVAVDFAVAPGWHIYGEPLPAGEGLTPTSIKFDSELVARQKIDLPKPTPLRFEALNETYPVYQGSFKAAGNIVLTQKLKAGDYSISGTLNFQECNDAICKMPQSVRFALPIKIQPRT